MRSFLLFTLAVVGLGILTDDASAGIFRRNRSRAAANYSAPAAQGACCDGSVGAIPGPGVMPMPTPGAGSVNPEVIRATDGTVYYRGADGSYYATPQGMTGQPYYGNYRTRGGYYASPGVYQAGYPGTPYPGVVPAGGTPLQMPAVPVPMPRK
jgi:hypothetical protein